MYHPARCEAAEGAPLENGDASPLPEKLCSYFCAAFAANSVFTKSA